MEVYDLPLWAALCDNESYPPRIAEWLAIEHAHRLIEARYENCLVREDHDVL